MAGLSVDVPVFQGGTTVLTLNFESIRSGSNNDRAQFRIVRRYGGYDTPLSGTPEMVLTSNKDIRSWTFIDPNVPNTGTYKYVLQIRRLDGGGTFYQMVLLAHHHKK